jgi:hypothetical protein
VAVGALPPPCNTTAEQITLLPSLSLTVPVGACPEIEEVNVTFALGDEELREDVRLTPGGALTTCASGAEALAALTPSPEYDAVIECRPAVKAAVAQLA